MVAVLRFLASRGGEGEERNRNNFAFGRRFMLNVHLRLLLVGLLVLLLVRQATSGDVGVGVGVAIIPDPPEPVMIESADRTNCPHLRGDLKDWNDPNTWKTSNNNSGSGGGGGGGVVPLPNSDVTLPRNTRVVIQETIPFQLGKITIPATSELIIGENPNGIELQTTGIHVLLGGALTIGSETCRIEQPVIITLLGERPDDAVASPPPPDYKGISVEGGTLHMHGKRYYQTWSRLATTVNPGDTVLALQRPVNWEAGQQIVLVTSSMYDTRPLHQNEVLTVASVELVEPPQTGEGGTVSALVHVQEPVQYSHAANSYYQVEVGLLSRTIVVQGSADDSEPTDPDMNNNCKFKACGKYYWLWKKAPQPCMNKELTGFGGHMIIHSGGTGYVEGVELYRMGQTNVLGRYPMHFHDLEDACAGCYFRDSSIHRSYYRCISVHGTNNSTVSENVAYDIIGFCYYLEDGVEEYNTISFNLAAHIHALGPKIATGCWDFEVDAFDQSDTLTVPADVSASGFYITNVHNYVIGNAASGGFAGFAFPSLPTPIGLHKDLIYRPSNAPGLVFDGNTVHSSGLWWLNAGAFYFGGSLYYIDGGDMLQYNPGRPFDDERDMREPCKVNYCEENPPYNDCAYRCPESEISYVRMTNSKVFLTPGIGINAWSGYLEVINYESYDSRLAFQALNSNVWVDNMFVVCRTGNTLGLPLNVTKASWLQGNGIFFYDSGVHLILTNAEFQHCGYRSDAYDQYDQSPTRGCEDDEDTGCSDDSTVFEILSFADAFTPQIMRGTRAIAFNECGRRFLFDVFTENRDNVASRMQSIIDADGTISGFGEPSLIGSGLESSSSWWRVDDEVVFDEQGPLSFIKQNNGPQRSLAHMRFLWDNDLHNEVENSICSDGSIPCPVEGYLRHLGYKFSPAYSDSVNEGYPLTASSYVLGPVGGFGWVFKLKKGAPRNLVITEVEVSPNSTLMLSIAYPKNTKVTIKAIAAYCDAYDGYKCQEVFRRVNSVAEVQNSLGNVYYMSAQGVLTMRVVEFSTYFTGNPNWVLPNYDTKGRYYEDGQLSSLPHFERNGILLPDLVYRNVIKIKAKCGGSGPYCSGKVANYDPDVCPSGFEQVAYDKCCSMTDSSVCTFADGST